MRIAPQRSGKLIRVPKPILGYEFVEFTTHVLDRMDQRGVTEEDILKVLSLNKQVPGPQPPRRTRIRWHKTAKMCVDVVYEKQKEVLGIITVVVFKARR